MVGPGTLERLGCNLVSPLQDLDPLPLRLEDRQPGFDPEGGRQPGHRVGSVGAVGARRVGAHVGEDVPLRPQPLDEPDEVGERDGPGMVETDGRRVPDDAQEVGTRELRIDGAAERLVDVPDVLRDEDLPGGIRTNARFSQNGTTRCIQSPGQTACVPYVDSRQTSTQLTMDTDLPPSIGAGLQVAYLLNEERQTNRKTSQFVITAFVSFTTSVGQLR